MKRSEKAVRSVDSTCACHIRCIKTIQDKSWYVEFSARGSAFTVAWRTLAASCICVAGAGRSGNQVYAQIDKEALAVTFACECFRDFITGFDAIVESDHRPLTAIAQKSLSDVPPRLQRFFLHLMPFNISLQYIPGKDLALADALSRI